MMIVLLLKVMIVFILTVIKITIKMIVINKVMKGKNCFNCPGLFGHGPVIAAGVARDCACG